MCSIYSILVYSTNSSSNWLLPKAMEEEKDDEDKDGDDEEDPGNVKCAGGKGKENKR